MLLPPQKLPAPRPKRERAPPPTPEPIVMPPLAITADIPRRALAAQVAAANGNAAAGRAVLADAEPEDAFFGALDTAPLPVPPAPVPVEAAPTTGPTAVPEAAPPTPAAEPTAAEGTREETAPGGAAPPPKVPGATAAAVATEAGEPPDAFFGPADPPLPVSTPDELARAVDRAAGKLPEPGFKGSPDRALDPLVGAAQTTGDAMRARIATSSVPQRVPPPRLPDPIEIDPVPKATDAVQAAVQAPLPLVTMPKPWSPPNGPAAVVKPLAGVTQQEVQTEEPPPPPEKPKELAKRAKDQRDAAKKKAEEAPVPVETPKPIPIDPPVLADWRPPPTPPPTKAEKTDVTAALAQVLADPTAEAKAIVAGARQQPVLFRGTLETVDLFKTIGDKDLVPQVETSLKAKMDELKKAVGIADEELTNAIEARKQLLADRAAGRQTETAKVVDAKAEALKKEAEKTKGEAEAKARREEVKRIRRLQAAQWSHDPKLIDELVEHRFGIIDADVGRAVVAHKKAGERRRALLDRFETAYRDAAREADDRAQMVKTADGKEVPIPPQFRRAPTINATPSAPGEPWLPWAEKEIRKAFDALRADTDKARDGLIADVEKAGLEARTAVREWAAKRLNKKREADKVQSDLADDKARQQKGDEAMAKEAVQTDTRDRLVTDVRAATQLHAILNDKDVRAGKAEDAELRKKQKEIAKQYLAAGNDPADPLSTVAAHLRGEFRMAQLLGEKDDGLLQKLRKQVLDTPIPSDVRAQKEFGKVLFSENQPDAYQRAEKAFQAMDIVGTEEKEVYRALAGLTPTQAQLVKLAYTDTHHRDLESHIRSEFSGAEKRRALALLNAQPVEAAAAAIEYAKPLLGGPASKEDRADIIEAIRQLPPGRAAELSAAYEKQTGDKLDDVLTETMRDFRADPSGGGFKPDDRGSEEAKLLIQLNVAQAPKKVDGKEIPPNQEEIDRLQAQVDALAFDRGLRTYGFAKPKAEADFAMVRGELERIRREVDQAHPEWTQDQVDAATRRRMAAMEYQFERRFGPEVSGGGKYGGTMQKLLSEQLMGGPKADLTRAQLYVDRRAEIAARLELEATDGAYATDDVLNANLQLNWDMAADRVKRSPDTQKLRDDLRTRMDADTRAGKAWDQPKIEAEERALDRKIEASIKAEAIVGMGEVKGRFGSMYGEKWGGTDEGALKRMLESETQGTGQWWLPGRASEQEAMWRLEQGGGLNRGQKILLGVHGYDMEREEVLGGLEGRTADEINDINEEFAVAAEKLEGKREDMFKRLRSESSGRNRFDIDEALRGIPITPEDRLAAMQRRIEWEKTAYFSGNATLRDAAAEAELAYMQREYDYAKERYNKFLDAKTKNLPVAERNALQVAFTEQSQVALAAADAYRKRVDSYVDTFVQIAAAAAAITAAVVVSVASGGTATPAMVALVASLWGTAATVVSKAYLLDKAYGIHELKGDLIVGGVDAVFAVATAGLGDKLLGIAKATGATQVALKEAIKRAAIQRAAKPLIARITVELVEQIAQAGPGALVGQALNRQNWRGDPFKNITTGALTQVGMGMGVGFTVGKGLHLGGMAIGAALERLKGLQANVFLPAAEAALHDPAALPRDSLLNRGTPAERMAAFREFKEKYPLATLSDFNEAVKRGQAILEAAADEVREMRRAMRTEVLADIPPRERARFAGTPIDVLSDAEFTARTGSQQKGIAAVLIVDGKPTIVVREGAGGTALAMALQEEGLHLRQVADPENATRIGRIDESRLARWPDLPLEERMASWRAKLELEIDAQLQRIQRLEARLSNTNDPLLRLDLEDELGLARGTHSVLDARLRELNAFDPTLRLPGGEGARPPAFTEEPPRLFAKRDASNSPAWREGLNAVETDRWREPWPDGTQRTYREVKIYDPATGRTTIRQEILLRDGNWHLRGSEAAKRGLRMELVSRAYTEAAVEAATAGGTAKLVPFDAQNKSGHGFDEVVFRFTRDSRGRLQARVGLIEVKDYPGRYVPSADFTAIDDNMRQNLLSVERRMQQLGPDRLGMTPQEFTAALNALRDRKLDVELRLGPDTKLGTGKNAATIPNLEADLQKRYPHGEVRVGHYDANGAWVDKRPVKLTGGLDEAALALERMQARVGEDRFTQLATTPSGAMTPSSILAADVIIKGERSGAIPGPCAWAPDRTYLHDASGRPVLVEPLIPVSAKSFDPEAIAERLVRLLDEQRPPAAANRVIPVQVLVDTSALTPPQVTRLQNALKVLARDRSRTIALGRLALVRAP